MFVNNVATAIYFSINFILLLLLLLCVVVVVVFASFAPLHSNHKLNLCANMRNAPNPQSQSVSVSVHLVQHIGNESTL